MADIQTWSLYIDETGDFDSLGERVAVVGLLHQGRLSDSALKNSIQQICSYYPYPYHSCVGNVSVSQVAGYWLNAPAPMVSQSLQYDLQRAKTLIERHGSAKLLRSFVDSIQEGNMPKLPALQDARTWLGKKKYELATRLDAERDRRVHHLQRFLQANYDAIVAQHPDRAVIVAAVGRASEERVQDTVANVWRDTYLDLLETVFERVVAVLRTEMESQTIRIETYVATRKIKNLRNESVFLTQYHVDDIARRAGTFPLHANGSRVVFVPMNHVIQYNRGVHAGVVLADIAANQLRRVLLDTNVVSLDDLVTETTIPLRWPIQMRALGIPTYLDVLPTIACPGTPRVAIDDAMRGNIPPAPGSLRENGWRRSQARAWINAATSLRNTKGAFGWLPQQPNPTNRQP